MHDYEIREKGILNEALIRCGDVKMSVIYGYLENNNNSYKDGDRHTHSTYEIHILMSGSMHISIDDNVYTLSGNDVIIIPPDTKHSISKVSNVNFKDMTIMFAITRRTGEHARMYDYVKYALKNIHGAAMFLSPEIAQNALKIDKLISKPNQFHTMNITCLMQSIVLYMFDIMISNNKKSPVGFLDDNQYIKDLYTVKRIEEYISNYVNPLSINGLADYIDVSKRTAQRLFQKLYGMNFTEKLTELRLNKAVELISTSSFSMEEISTRVGYHTYSAFRKAFVNYFGVSPNNYRIQKES